MNLYVRLITDTVEYIDDHLCEPISLQTIAERFHVSAFHFNRIFSTVTGQTLKQYILGRKLSATLDALACEDRRVIDIAYDYGFTYPEVYSRAFKKLFGLSPEAYRRQKPIAKAVPKACVVERDITNYQGRMALVGEPIRLVVLTLWGQMLAVDVNSDGFRMQTQATADAFIARATADSSLNESFFYNAVRCHGKENGEYALFMGFAAVAEQPPEGLAKFIVPGGAYMRFRYTGDMYDIRSAFADDLYRWVMVREVALRDCEVGMLCVYRADYPTTHVVEILVPIAEG